MKQTGTLLNRSEVKTFEGGFSVQEFYMDCKTYDQNTGQEFPNKLKFQVIGERVNTLAQFKRGERLTLDFNIKGREFQKEDGTTGHIQNLNVWKIERAVQYNAQPTTPQYQAPASAQSVEDEDDDLPF